ncbi:MAG: nucleotide sugar dehydrogenase [Thermoleophilaceae bacterium]|nr:nucleotide sugar dehydrogenase [Thermoleophilaceae bacterium]
MKVGIIGLGYVGLPLAVAFGDAGAQIVGVDTDTIKLTALNRGRSYIEDVSDDQVAGVVGAIWTADFEQLSSCDAVIIAVPTPLTVNREPDLGALVGSATSLAKVLRQGQLVVLESTTYPGTTRERLVPLLEESGMKAGQDFHVAFSPERIDPGNSKYQIRNTPKIVGGDGVEATQRAKALYTAICDEIVEVSTPEVAEMTKLLENVFRAVNIALVNELAVICDRMDIDVWEVVEAAATKPFGFMSFRPGPGLGGHCLPVDPFYLSWKAREYGLAAEFVELAGRTNQNMPRFCAERTVEALNRAGTATTNATVAILGVAYKPGVGDLRESPALSIMEQLNDLGTTLIYHDPHVPTLDAFNLVSQPLDEVLEQADLVVIVTAHSEVDYQRVVDASNQVLDFRGVTRGIEAANVVRL